MPETDAELPDDALPDDIRNSEWEDDDPSESDEDE